MLLAQFKLFFSQKKNGIFEKGKSDLRNSKKWAKNGGFFYKTVNRRFVEIRELGKNIRGFPLISGKITCMENQQNS